MKSENVLTRISFRTAQVAITDNWIIATFADGKENTFYIPGVGTSDYRDIARWGGYKEDWWRYAIEHEVTHHFVADNLGWNYSWAVHDDIRYEGEWPNHIAWEEHLVNNLQRYMHTGELDKENILNLVFGNRLEYKVKELETICKKVLDKEPKIYYNHESGLVTIGNQ